MAPVTPQKRTRFDLSSRQPTSVKKTPLFLASDEEGNSPTVSSDKASYEEPAQKRQKVPPSPMTPTQSMEKLARFGALQLETPPKSKLGQHSHGIQATHALEIDENLAMEQDSGRGSKESEQDEKEEEQEVAEALLEEMSTKAKIKEYIYPPPLPNFGKIRLPKRDFYGPEPEMMDDESIQHEKDNLDEKPVRIANNFVFFLDSSGNLNGMGAIYPKVEEEDGRPIIDSYQSYNDTYTRASIWVETQFAWYTLDHPHPLYQTAFRPFLLAHTYLHLLFLFSEKYPDADLAHLERVLDKPHGLFRMVMENVQKDLDPPNPLKIVDFWSHIAGVRSAFLHQGDHTIMPLMETIFGKDLVQQHPSSHHRHPPAQTNLPSPPNSVTPFIYSIGNQHFIRRLKCLGKPLPEGLDYTNTSAKSKQLLRAHENSECQVKVSSTHCMEEDQETIYTRILINGVCYQRGDVVLVIPGEDSRKDRQAEASDPSSMSPNALANYFWFAKIISFFEGENGFFFHAQWLLHSSKSFLKETSDPQEVFLLPECNDCPVESIVRHINLDCLLDPEEEPGVMTKPSRFYCRFLYDQNKGCFSDVGKLWEEDLTLDATHCLSCAFKAEDALHQTVRFLEQPQRTVLFDRQVYHASDFVYIRPQVPGPYIRGQISCFIPKEDRIRVSVRLFDWSRNPQNMLDEKLLILQDQHLEFNAERLAGLWFAKPYLPQVSDKWLQMPNHFFVAQHNSRGRSVNFDYCITCCQEEQKQLKRRSKTFPLRALDLFSGCGGFHLGMDQSKLIRTQWSVENNAHAAKTLRENMPAYHRVIEEDINEVLSWVHQQASAHDADPRIPHPDEVEVIYGGPPCQSFSHANSFKRDDDPRHSLSLTALSFVELYKPSYVILENVRGMIKYPLLSPRGSIMEQGMPKLWLRCLTGMGYQAQISILEAGAYGTPQSRARVIVIAAKRGLTLPAFPQPTHTFPKTPHPFRSPDGVLIHSPSSIYAKFSPITIQKAIDDLPKFDWTTTGSRSLYRPSFHHERGWGQVLNYQAAPRTRYQMELRSLTGRVQQHFTKVYPSLVTERVLHIPLQPGACWKDLPEDLLDPNWEHRPLNKSAYKRLNKEDFFPTSTCNVDPVSRFGHVLHPTQKRVITLREYARAQGFPDAFVFWTITPQAPVRELFKQIGNAVPVPLAAALGESVAKAIIADFSDD